MTDAPLVSVIVPTYNRPDFLTKTIQSVLNQTYSNLELIVISNGKNADNEKTVKKFTDPRIHYADQENSGGPSGPRNHGMRLAKGKYIAVCDDDDLWTPDKLEKQVTLMETDPACGLCYTNMVFFDETGKEWTDGRGQADFKTLRYKNAVPISSVMIRADLFKTLGGFEENKAVGDSEDYEFVLRYATKTKLCFINEELIKYWSGVGRTTATDKERTIKDNWSHLKDVIGCHSLVIQKMRTNPLLFVLPFFYHLQIFAKSSAYLSYQKLKPQRKS